ncbi:hypothetical protein RU97_GL002453 [Enterococcus canis]|uniref:4Fe-4S ferredoxin-type domain-containing protein n=1 Tax=Enterococcus canis TaxID=214095 RepID=A0A1L8RD44_9ENTE|nr:hypothetical protein RU97_GL002453 [Enterococcus canis]
MLKADRMQHKVIMKCDMCLDHPTKSPQCVEKCPMQAITLEEVTPVQPSLEEVN